MTSRKRVLLSGGAGLLLGASLALLPACFQAPLFSGPYACTTDESCGGNGYVCSDGICCQPRGEPLCLTFVFPDGSCADGGTAQTYYEDLDGDGFGNENNPRRYCGPPNYDKFVTKAGDCNDNPVAGGQLSYPGADEQCDGQDNDCDGIIDEGRPLQVFYRDQDSDGYGDATQTMMACKAPVGYVDNSLDCEPADNNGHPGAVEQCNNRDDDCDGVTDEEPEGTGDPCSVDGGVGACRQGRQICRFPESAQKQFFCAQTVQPSPDYCDGIDNNCNGSTDEKPDCGGPNNFIPVSPEVTVGSVDLKTAPSGIPGSCIRDLQGTAPEPTQPGRSANAIVWTGSGSTGHSLFLRPPSGRYWDLTKPGTELKFFSGVAMTNPSVPPWKEHNQPVFMLCGPKGYIRLVFRGTPPDGVLLGTGGGAAPAGNRIVYSIPVNSPDPDPNGPAPNRWIARPYPDTMPVADILKQVDRIDVLVEPKGPSTFTLTIDTFGLY